MGKTVTKSGTSPLVIIFMFVLAAVVLFGIIAIVRIVNPELLYPITGDPTEDAIRQKIELEGEVTNLEGELNATYTENGELRAALRREQLRTFRWPVFIAILIVGLIIAWILWRNFQGRKLLTVEEAEAKYIPKARVRYGYYDDEYPAVKKRPKSIERVKKTSSIDRDERMYFLEFEFIKRGAKSLYIKGLRRPQRENVVTVAILNGSDEIHQQWFPFMSLNESMEEAHKAELWGFALQKTRREDDVLAALQDGNSVKEVRDQYQSDDDTEARA